MKASGLFALEASLRTSALLVIVLLVLGPSEVAAKRINYRGIKSGPSTEQYKLVSLSPTGVLMITPAGASGGALGICQSPGCSKANNNPKVTVGRVANCIFDANPVTIGDYVEISKTVAGAAPGYS
jgi:hypothetical protein